MFPWSREVMWQIKKRYISTSTRPCQLKLKDWWLIKRGHHPQLSHDKKVARRIKKNWNFCFYMAHDYRTGQGDGLWYWTTTHKVAWFFNHVITCSLMANEKRYISNSTSPMVKKLERVLAYEMGHCKIAFIGKVKGADLTWNSW